MGFIFALSGFVNVGTIGGYPVHMIEHTLSACHDITRAAGLAAVNPSWMHFAARHRPQKLVQFADFIAGYLIGLFVSCLNTGGKASRPIEKGRAR